jgi:hypothetical protein
VFNGSCGRYKTLFGNRSSGIYIPSLEPLVMQDLISEEVAGMKIVTSHVSAYGCSDFFVRGIEYLYLNNIL